MSLQPVDKDRTHLVQRFFTPIAVLLVANGIILSEPPSPRFGLSLGLLVFSILFNSVSLRWIDRAEETGTRRLNLRVWVNFMASVGQLHLLGANWEPAWMLLLLTPIASAIYGNRANTILFSFLSLGAILAIHGLRAGESSPLEWATQGTHGAVIILLSLALYELSRQLYGSREEPAP